MAYTRCKLFVDAIAKNELNIGPKKAEEFCFIPETVYHDGLGMTSTGKLVIPSDGEYRIIAIGLIHDGAPNDYLYFGFDYLGANGEDSVGQFDNYSRITLKCDSAGDEVYGCVSDVATFTSGQVIGCHYLRGSTNTVNIKACCPTIIIEKIA